MKVLLINLARLGDLVQTSPAAQALKRMHGAEVSLLAGESLAGFAEGIAGVDEVIPFQESLLVPGLRSGGEGLGTNWKLWKQWVDDLRSRGFDRVVNLTHERYAARLAGMIGAPAAFGRCESPGGTPYVRGRWLRHFFAAHHSRRANPFNLCDIYRHGVGGDDHPDPVKYVPSDRSLAAAQRLLAGLPRPVVALHPGANHPNRRWPAEYFAALADRVAETGATPLLLGGPGETALADGIADRCSSRVRNLAGVCSLEELSGLLAAVDLLVTNDTGPLHLAAAVGTRTVSLFLAMARPEDTAPYRGGQWVFETLEETHPCPEEHPCPNPVCGGSIPVEAVAETVFASLAGREPDTAHLLAAGGRFRLVQTGFDSRGILTLEEYASTHPTARPGEKAAALRPLWLALLEGSEPARREKEQAVRVLEPSERDALVRALQLSGSILGRWRRLAGDSGGADEASLATLEARWGELEPLAGDLSGMLLSARLERERYYAEGPEAVVSRGVSRLEGWVRAISSLPLAQVEPVEEYAA